MMTDTGNNLTVAENWLRESGFGGQIALEDEETVTEARLRSLLWT